jgi:asparagine synthase (glutamine-hydrolysing)
MTGIAGGTVDGAQLGRMVDALEHEAWYSADRFEAEGYGLGARHHGERDPHGHAFWTDGRKAGAIDGAITNRAELGWDTATIFERLLDAPERTLEALEGPFTIACLDASRDRILLGMDKIGCRTPFYSTENGFLFGSGLGPLLQMIDDPVLDEQGISDLLLMGHMWSDTTLLQGVKALHPATVVEYRDGELTERRYWHPEYEPARPTDQYLHELTTAFQRAVDRTARSVSGDVGLWLSGGLDSRATVNELARSMRNGDGDGSLVTYTYDANPGGGVNPRLAGAVAEALELPNEVVPLSPDRFLPVLEKAVDVSDGMVKWNTLLNLTAVFNIERTDPDVVMEGLEGAVVGHHLLRYHLTEPSSLVQSMYRSEAALTTAEVDDLLEVSVDPLGSFRKEVDRIDECSFEKAVVDAHFQNYYSRLAHASNTVPRSQVGTRVPYADGDFLSRAVRLPVSWRMGVLPFSDGELMFGVVKPKIEMIRALNTDLAEIPYERSRLKPTYPYPLHVAGFYASTALEQLRSNPTYGGKSMTGEWYRSHDGLRETLNGLLDDACDRPFFNPDAIREYQQRTLRGEGSEMSAISAITTIELWLQRHLD